MVKHKTIVLKDNEVFDGLNDGERGGIFTKTEFKKLFSMRGDNITIRNINVSHPAKDFDRVISVEGKDCLIESCVFTEYDVNGAIIVLERKKWNKIPDNLIIKDCLFLNGRKTKENNGNECIRLGHSESSLKGAGRCIVIGNRFENFNREIETISVKCHMNILVNNTFINSSTLTLRHGTGSIVAFNKFDNKNNKNLGGVRIVDSKHFIDNNLFMNINGDNPLRCAVSIMCGVKNSPLNRYLPARDINIRENVFVNCSDVLALGVEKKEADIKPYNVNIEANKFIKCGTVISKKVKEIKKNNNQIGYSLNVKDNTLDFNTELVKFELKDYVSFATEILDYQNENEENESEAEEKKVDPDLDEKTEKKEIPISIQQFMDKLIKRLRIVEKENRIRNIQKRMQENLNEYKDLMKEFKSMME